MMDEPRLVASKLGEPWDIYTFGPVHLGMAAFEPGLHWGFCPSCCLPLAVGVIMSALPLALLSIWSYRNWGISFLGFYSARIRTWNVQL